MKSLMKNERGIAMAEAVIVMPFFIIVWMALIALHHLYDGRLEAQVVSMGTALSHSYKGCKGDESPVGDPSGKTATIAPEASGWVERIAGEQPFGWTHTHGRCTIAVDGIPAPFGGPEVDVKAQQTVMCNMRPKDGLIELVFDMVKSIAGG